MTNYFSANTYPSQVYPQPAQKKGPSTFGMITLGAIGGGTVGYFKNRMPVDKNGKVSDSFAKQVYENISKVNSKDNELYKQSKKILKKLDNIKDVEGLKKLLKDNKECARIMCEGMNTTIDNILSTISSGNLKATKEALKGKIQATNNIMYQLTKNSVEKSWDSEAKKFIKPDKMDSKIFDIIKKTKNSGQWKKALKYGGITAGVMGALTIGYKILTSKI